MQRQATGFFTSFPTWLLDLVRMCLRVFVSRLPPVRWLHPLSFPVFMTLQLAAAQAWCHREVRCTAVTSEGKKKSIALHLNCHTYKKAIKEADIVQL